MRAYRGKRKDNGEWVYGWCCFNSIMKSAWIIDLEEGCSHAYEVVPDTVGQDTGLTDKNGKHIFEGDIVNAVYQSGYAGIENTDFGNGIVLYFDSYYGGASYHIDMIGELGYRVFSAGLQDGVTVLGNIFDNPELTEKSC